MSLFKLDFLIEADRTRRLNGDRKQRFHAFFANTLSPAREAGGINGQLSLQYGLATKVLPVRVLQPSDHYCLIGGIVGVL